MKHKWEIFYGELFVFVNITLCKLCKYLCMHSWMYNMTLIPRTFFFNDFLPIIILLPLFTGSSSLKLKTLFHVNRTLCILLTNNNITALQISWAAMVYVETGGLFKQGSSYKNLLRGGRGAQMKIGTFSSNDFFICKTFTCVFLRNINSKQILLTHLSN